VTAVGGDFVVRHHGDIKEDQEAKACSEEDGPWFRLERAEAGHEGFEPEPCQRRGRQHRRVGISDLVEMRKEEEARERQEDEPCDKQR